MTTLTTNFTFLSAPQPFVKTYTPTEVIDYPNIKNVTSITESYEHNLLGFTNLFNSLVMHAENGNCLLKGNLIKPLENESRAGKTERSNTTTWVFFDIDKADINLFGAENKDLDDYSEAFIRTLPKEFHNISYIRHLGSSYGRDPESVSLHLLFLLDSPCSILSLKNMIKNTNLNDPYTKSLRLSSTGMSLCWTIDPCVIDNSRILTIADPAFQGIEPFTTRKRFEIIEKGPCLVNVTTNLNNVNTSKAKYKKILNSIRTTEGLEEYKPKLAKYTDRNQPVDVCINPDEMQMQVAYENEDWVYYNINGGDSNAYYVWKKNPRIVYNFKGEEPFLFKKADPDAFANHITLWGHYVENQETPFVFRDLETDTYYNALLTLDKKSVIDVHKTSRASIKSFMSQYNEPIDIDAIETWRYVFDPTQDCILDIDEKFINKFRAPVLMRQKEAINLGDSFDTWSLRQFSYVCPTIYKILYSVAGSDDQCVHRFMNWLAYVFQTRSKTKTAWIFHGTQGTGKGVLFNEILRPLFGQYAIKKTIENFDEKFNDFLDHSLICCIDEFHLKDSKNPNKLKNKLNEIITEPTTSIRSMHQGQRDTESYVNIIIFSNEYNIMSIHSEDRRFNVAPRQELSIRSRYIKKDMDIIEDIENKLPNELEDFTKILKGFPIDETLVQVPMDNDAKTRVREYGETTIHEFANAFKSVDMDYFLEVFDRRLPLIGEDNVTPAKSIIKNWIATLLDNKQIRASTSQLFTVYLAIVGTKTNESKFQKILSNVGIDRKNIVVDDTGRRVRAYVLPKIGLNDIQKQNIKHYLDEPKIISAKPATK